MNMSWFALAIEFLELMCESQERHLSRAHIRMRYPMLIHKTDPKDEFTVVREIFFRENSIEKSGS